VAKIANNKEHAASPKSANVKTQPSLSPSKLSVESENIKNKNNFSKIISCLKF
jgi:hypothetical protein